MRPVTAKFLAAVAGSHHMNTRVTVLTSVGQNGVSPTGTVIPLEKGTVTFDSTAQVWGTADLTTSYPWPVSTSDLLTPYGNEVFIERGVVYGGGATEWVSLGYYSIQTVEQRTAPKGAVELTCSDRMQGIINARITAPISFAAGTTIAAIIEYLVQDVYSWAVINVPTSLTTTTISVAQTTTDDRYGFLNDLITSYGMIWYWDYRGQLAVKPVPNPAVPVATLKTGTDGVLVTMSRGLDRTGIYNGAVASAQQAAAGAQVFSVVVDQDPTSPTYWYGKFGKVPQFYSSSFLQTTDQCTSAAIAMLQKSTGFPYEIDFGFIPNPALELLDPVTLLYGTTFDTHVLKQLVVGLSATDTMTAQTKQLLTNRWAKL